jgi:hypothetical protein
MAEYRTLVGERVRRERRRTSAGETPARELVRSTCARRVPSRPISYLVKSPDYISKGLQSCCGLRNEPIVAGEKRQSSEGQGTECGHLDEHVCSSLERHWLAVGGRAVVNVGCNNGKRSPRLKAASLGRRGFWVFHGHRVWHLRSGYGHSLEPSGWCCDLRCGSLLRNFADPARVASENFGVETA